MAYPRNALHNYKNRRAPSGCRLLELANYFQVKSEYLIGKSELVDQHRVDYIFEKLSIKEKLEFLKFLQNWVENIIKTDPLL
ncbi:XRE family transcriptional regulator [Lactococcus lactis]|uniref:XRE family transcriptional regulator n=1 Tax=Lactococcus lactis TaxID=1358 RepID=UPI00211D8058|nr:XRE family transcriptional regulator [Lactococcus lactis]